jgi:DNA-binding CsgD family transcriptional regulator
MSKKYKLYPIRTIKDWEGNDWDVYEERKSFSGIMAYKGWPYSLTPRDGIGGQFSNILTPEVAEFLKAHSIRETEQELGLSNSIIAKFRRTLGIQNKFIYRNDRWLLEHQEELLYDSLETLKIKYGLNRNQVYQHKKWLADLISIPTRKRIRKKKSDDLQELWFQEHKDQMVGMSIQEITITHHISHFRAQKIYNRIRKELGELSFSEQFKKNKLDKYQWIIDNKDELLNQGKTVAELAERFQKTTGQILRARVKLRETLKTPKVKDQNRAWLIANQKILLDTNLSKEDLAKRLNIKPSQVNSKKAQLKKLLNIPHYNDQVQAWRIQNQEILLSLHLRISEIAKILNCKEKYIVKNRMILRNFLGITKQDQIEAWVLKNQYDLERLSIENIEEKYKIERYTIQKYQKILVTFKQNETNNF